MHAGSFYDHTVPIFGQQQNLFSDPAMQIQPGIELDDIITDAAFERAFDAAHFHIRHQDDQMQQEEVGSTTDLKMEEQSEQAHHAAYLMEIPRIGSDRIIDQDISEMQEYEGRNDADELARTAGQLLDNLKHDQSRKFQESSFLSLMRQLRDREVRVEGDKLVEVSNF